MTEQGKKLLKPVGDRRYFHVQLNDLPAVVAFTVQKYTFILLQLLM